MADDLRRRRRRVAGVELGKCHLGGSGRNEPQERPQLFDGVCGLGLAVYLLLSRFDDHIAYCTLERIFRERHGVIIPRQQMVQWVEKIAFLLLAIYHGIWEELQATGFLQVDETPVKVLDPEVKGKAATATCGSTPIPNREAAVVAKAAGQSPFH